MFRIVFGKMSGFADGTDQNQDEEHRPFVKIQGINAEDARRRREDLTVSIRKNKREETLQKRRRAIEPEGPGLAQVSESVRFVRFLTFFGALVAQLHA